MLTIQNLRCIHMQFVNGYNMAKHIICYHHHWRPTPKFSREKNIKYAENRPGLHKRIAGPNLQLCNSYLASSKLRIILGFRVPLYHHEMSWVMIQFTELYSPIHVDLSRALYAWTQLGLNSVTLEECHFYIYGSLNIMIALHYFCSAIVWGSNFCLSL